MKEQEFKKEVMHELEMIKEYATNEEIGKLNFNTLNPDMTTGCIYGQMTGSCDSKRTMELLGKCCLVFIKSASSKVGISIHKHINENPLSRRNKYAFMNDVWSPLEAYITLGLNNKGVIKYLKGENKTLKL